MSHNNLTQREIASAHVYHRGVYKVSIDPTQAARWQDKNKIFIFLTEPTPAEV